MLIHVNSGCFYKHRAICIVKINVISLKNKRFISVFFQFSFTLSLVPLDLTPQTHTPINADAHIKRVWLIYFLIVFVYEPGNLYILFFSLSNSITDTCFWNNAIKNEGQKCHRQQDKLLRNEKKKFFCETTFTTLKHSTLKHKMGFDSELI